MEKKFEDRFLLPEQYNKAIRGDTRHYNCLAFALGVTDYEFLDFMLDKWFFPNIIDAFNNRTKYFRIGVQKVDNVNDIHGYGFILFGWVDGLYRDDGFHLARIEPNGQIVHKLGIKEIAGYVTLNNLLQIYRNEPHYFFQYTGEQKPVI